MRALVAGGTGRLGRIVVRTLLEAGATVRVLTRDERRVERLQTDRPEVAVGDVRRPESLLPAVRDVDLVISAVHGFAGPGHVSPRSVDRDGNANLVAAARAAGADVLLMSIVGAAPDSPLELARYKYAAEQQLRSSGVPWTIVRATAFLELWVDLVSTGVVFGRGDNPINFVSVHDVADVVARAALERGQRGQVIELGGPRDISFNDLAQLLREVRGRPSQVRHVPRWLLRGLAPLHRQPRAALVMDTTDLTFPPGSGRQVGATDVDQALSRLPVP